MRTPRRLILLCTAMFAVAVVAYAGLREPAVDVADRPTLVGVGAQGADSQNAWRDVLAREPTSLDDLAEALRRPLFREARRPPAPVVVESAPEPAPPAGVGATLTGVVVSRAGQIALLTPDGGAKVRRLSVGETYEAWTVTEIGPDFVILESEAGIETLHLRYRRRNRE